MLVSTDVRSELRVIFMVNIIEEIMTDQISLQSKRQHKKGKLDGSIHGNLNCFWGCCLVSVDDDDYLWAIWLISYWAEISFSKQLGSCFLHFDLSQINFDYNIPLSARVNS